MPSPHGGRKVRRCRLGGWGCEIRRPRERLSSEGAGALAGRGACRSPRGGLMAPSGTSSSSWGRRRWGWGCSWLSARPPVPLARPGMPGARRPRCPLRSEVWVSGSLGRVGGKPMPRAFRERTGCGRATRSFDSGQGSWARRGGPGCPEGMPSVSWGLAGLPGRRPHPGVPSMTRWRPHVSPELTTMGRGGLPVGCA